MSLAGELRLQLRVQGGRIAALQVQSSRPDVARALLSGKPVASVRAAVPLLFAVCSDSQAAACRLALAAACGEPQAPLLDAAPSAVAAESLRDAACQVLLRWPGWIDEQPQQPAVAAVRALMAWTGAADTAGLAAAGRDGVAAPPRPAVLQDCAHAVFGCSAAEWLARHARSWQALQGWAGEAATPAARVLGPGRGQPLPPAQAAAVGAVSSLPPPAAPWLLPLAQRALDDPGFCAAPRWQGQAAETGPLAHWRAADPTHAAMQPAPHGADPLQQRLLARLWHLAALLEGRARPAAGCAALASGTGVGWVDSPRGLLVHVARVAGSRVLDYRIVAPTEWNMHPQGVLGAALVDAPVRDPGHAQALGAACLRALDPCVAWRVEVDHA